MQAVSLIASYLEVPLRYPLRLGGSRSYINDYAPSIEPTPTDSVSNSLLHTNLKPIEFPLFLEGQDTTRAAYAVFLLNKVCFLLYVIFAAYGTHKALKENNYFVECAVVLSRLSFTQHYYFGFSLDCFLFTN